MERNLDRRVEAMVPIEDLGAHARLAEIVDVLLADDRHSWQLGSDATWRRTEVLESREGTIGTFEVLKERALDSGDIWTDRRPGAGAGSLDPRA
jgi:polyphosphate kinase